MLLCRHPLGGIRLIATRYASTKPALTWPLDNDTRLSSKLKDIEAYWVPKLQNAPVGSVQQNQNQNQNARKKYILSMFPYPSGMLHMGHMRVYSISDVLARYYKLNGFEVIHPIGWDAFGLPAENAAIQRGVDPKEWTYSNAAVMKRQLLQTGVQFDWDREFYTCDPSYYKWTQWIFTRLHKHDLVHRTVAEVNWDPVDKTVLASEQIDAHGRSWRSGAPVEKRKLAQWMIETPKYAKRLLDGLESLRGRWREVADIQANWIGKCDVYRFCLPLQDGRTQRPFEKFDLRLVDPTALAQARFVVVQRDHYLAREEGELPEGPAVLKPTVLNFVTGQQMPVVVLGERVADNDYSEYVLHARLGTDTDLEIFQLLDLKPENPPPEAVSLEKILNLAKEKRTAGYLTSRTLLDWVVSRQRTWGTPIPMALTTGSNAFPVTDESLPVLTEHRGTGYVSLGHEGSIETDTLDTFFDSSWYYLRYLDPKNDQALVSKDLTEKYMPVDIYVGGIEHAAVHMFFARFMSYFLSDIGVIAHEEPFSDLVVQGIVRGRTYIDPDTGEYVPASDVEKHDSAYVRAKTGAVLESFFEKMSKSKHNGVDPLDVIAEQGSEFVRLQLLDAASPKANLDWAALDAKGLRLWIDRIGWIVNAYVEGRKQAAGGKQSAVPDAVEAGFKENYNFFVRNTSMLLEVLQVHNTAISRLQGLTNALRKIDPSIAGQSREFERCVHALVTMLQVFAPNCAAELWSALCEVPALDSITFAHDQDVFKQSWPSTDPDAEIDFIVTAKNVNCGRASIPRPELEDLSDAQVAEQALAVHADFFTALAAKGISHNGFSVTRREGLHTTVDLHLPEGVTESEIRVILDGVVKERVRAAKESRKRKKSAKAT